jgi:predicted nucleotidyltransferase
MRLSSREVTIIKNIIRNLDSDAKIFLYGSRTQDHLAGGDIDLIVVSESLKFGDKISILTELKWQLGDQKFDLTVCSKSQSTTLPFVVEALSTAICLSESGDYE